MPWRWPFSTPPETRRYRESALQSGGRQIELHARKELSDAALGSAERRYEQDRHRVSVGPAKKRNVAAVGRPLRHDVFARVRRQPQRRTRSDSLHVNVEIVLVLAVP